MLKLSPLDKRIREGEGRGQKRSGEGWERRKEGGDQEWGGAREEIVCGAGWGGTCL
jgi:hypothetical protein